MTAILGSYLRHLTATTFCFVLMLLTHWPEQCQTNRDDNIANGLALVYVGVFAAFFQEAVLHSDLQIKDTRWLSRSKRQQGYRRCRGLD